MRKIDRIRYIAYPDQKGMKGQDGSLFKRDHCDYPYTIGYTENDGLPEKIAGCPVRAVEAGKQPGGDDRDKDSPGDEYDLWKASEGVG